VGAIKCAQFILIFPAFIKFCNSLTREAFGNPLHFTVVLPFPITSLTFIPLSHCPLLIIWCISNHVYFYHLTKKCFIDHPLSPVSSSSPAFVSLLPSREKIIRISFLPSSSDTSSSATTSLISSSKILVNHNFGLLIQTVNYLILIKFNFNSSKKEKQETSINSSQSSESKKESKRSKKKKKWIGNDPKSKQSLTPKWKEQLIENEYGTAQILFIDKFRPMLFAQTLVYADSSSSSSTISIETPKKKIKLDSKKQKQGSPSSSVSESLIETSSSLRTHIVVVELPWLLMVQSLPQPLYRHRYGT